MSYTEDDKLQWEVQKIQAEVKNLKSIVTRYFAIAIAILGCLTAVYTWRKAVNDANSASITLALNDTKLSEAKAEKSKAVEEKATAEEAERRARKEEELAAKRQQEQEQASIQRLLKLQGEISLLDKQIAEKIERLKATLPTGPGAAKSQLDQLAENIQENTSRIQQDASKAVADLVHDGTKARLFIFVNGPNQCDSVNQIKPVLDGRGFFVANVLQNDGRRSFLTEVRYFRHPQDRLEAEAILKILQDECGLKKSRISYVEDRESIGSGRKYQIWLRKDAFVDEQ